MQYIVLDLEWNQAMSSKSSVYNRLPIRLRGEIIQIGAVKLNSDMTPGEEYQIDVKPIYFKKMHYKVKKLTGIDTERLKDACGFKEAMAEFRAWCGDGCTFLTWGYDDRGIMEQNIIIHDLDWDWISGWVNLQLIYNMQTEGDKNQKALSTAMEHFDIEQTRVAHDALGDAYNTALVCSRLDMASGLAKYDDAVHILNMRARKSEVEGEPDGPAPVEHITFSGYATRGDAFSDTRLSSIACPECSEKMTLLRWIDQGDRRYMTIADCSEHGKYLVRIKFRKTEDETWTVNRIAYNADDDMVAYYNEKAAQSRKRVRRRRKAKAKSEE